MIQAFEKIIQERGWGEREADILTGIQERLSSHIPDSMSFDLTKFQKDALASEGFWRDWSDDVPRHSLIQGATSAGKTLLSELNIIDTLSHGGKAVVLVPLKAMVRERTEQLEEDLSKYYKRVYGSSSDYLEHDERLIEGEYQVAVIVYEKFFAMMSQGSSKIIEDCSLVVVDELSMLSKAQRGPKLEIAIESVRIRNESTRIMCLATCDCSAEKVGKWLKARNVFRSTARPVSLEEHIVEFSGDGFYREIPAETDSDFVPERRKEKVDVEGYQDDWSRYDKQRALLKAVLRREYARNPDARTLIFVASRAETVRTSTFLSELTDIFPKVDPKIYTESDIYKDIAKCDHDEDRDILLNKFIPHGIAFHHAGISTNLREVIEREFKNQNARDESRDSNEPEPFLKAIVATETLTIGVNLPFDIMIIVNNRVPKGLGMSLPITLQEYRNYIGRAGRLGQSNRGISYLFVESYNECEKYWRSYNNTEEIESALTNAESEEIAPYYLCLLKNDRQVTRAGAFVEADVSRIYDESLSKLSEKTETDEAETQQEEDAGSTGSDNKAEPTKSKRIIKDLVQYYLAKELPQAGPGLASGPQASYELLDFGRLISTYALSLPTCYNILWKFVDGYKYGGFPSGTTREDIDNDVYLLDTLYHICLNPEVRETSLFVFPEIGGPSGAEAVYNAREAVLKVLGELLDDPANRLWCEAYADNGELLKRAIGMDGIYKVLYSGESSDTTPILQAATRAIILYFWTKGATIQDIRDRTKFGGFLKRIINGDVERLAEIVSFQLDAIYTCFNASQLKEEHTGKNRFLELNRRAGIETESDDRAGGGKKAQPVLADVNALKAFYSLQKRVNYGMPSDLVLLANKHVHGLDRSQLLALRQKALDKGLSPIAYFYSASDRDIQRFMTSEQQYQLRHALEQRGSDEFGILMEQIRHDLGSALAHVVEDGLESTYKWDGKGDRAIRDLLESLDDVLQDEAFEFIYTSRLNEERGYLLWHDETCGDRSGDVCLAVLDAKFTEVDVADAARFFRTSSRYRERPRILVVPWGFHRDDANEESRDAEAVMRRREILKAAIANGKFDAVVDVEFLTRILASAIHRRFDKGETLMELLRDLRGIFNKADYISLSLTPYKPASPSDTKPAFRILAGYRHQSERSSNVETSTFETGNFETELKRTEELANFEFLQWGRHLDELREQAEGFTDCPTFIVLDRRQVQHSKSLTKFLTWMQQQSFHNCKMLFRSSDVEAKWRAAIPDDPTDGNPWNPALATIPGVVVGSAQEAVGEVEKFIHNWDPTKYLIGICYPGYDGQHSSADSDHALLQELCERLAEIYGEDVILYDKFAPAKFIFPYYRGKEESLKAYDSCRLHLVLWSEYTPDKKNCKDELETITAACDEGRASCIYLTTDRPNTPKIPGKSYSQRLARSEIDHILELVNDRL